MSTSLKEEPEEQSDESDLLVSKAKYQRALADLENLRKRKESEIRSAHDRGEAEAIRRLLPIIDHLELASKAAAEAKGEEALAQVQAGIQHVVDHARRTLAQLEVEGFESVGKTFTAELMDAIAEVPTRALPPATVAEEVSRGYNRRGKLLRPAQVAVAVAPRDDEEGNPP